MLKCLPSADGGKRKYLIFQLNNALRKTQIQDKGQNFGIKAREASGTIIRFGY
jgi:hypothetical protein